MGIRWLGTWWLGTRWLGAWWLGAWWLGTRWLGAWWLGAWRWMGAWWRIRKQRLSAQCQRHQYAHIELQPHCQQLPQQQFCRDALRLPQHGGRGHGRSKICIYFWSRDQSGGHSCSQVSTRPGTACRHGQCGSDQTIRAWRTHACNSWNSPGFGDKPQRRDPRDSSGPLQRESIRDGERERCCFDAGQSERRPRTRCNGKRESGECRAQRIAAAVGWRNRQ